MNYIMPTFGLIIVLIIAVVLFISIFYPDQVSKLRKWVDKQVSKDQTDLNPQPNPQPQPNPDFIPDKPDPAPVVEPDTSQQFNPDDTEAEAVPTPSKPVDCLVNIERADFDTNRAILKLSADTSGSLTIRHDVATNKQSQVLTFPSYEMTDSGYKLNISRAKFDSHEMPDFESVYVQCVEDELILRMVKKDNSVVTITKGKKIR